MTTANLHETVLAYKIRRNQLQNEISSLQAQKTLATAAQADHYSDLSSRKSDIRKYYKELFEADPELQELYKDYTEIPDFEEEIDKITAQFNDELEELMAWETQVDAQITTCDAELKEVEAFITSFSEMLSSNLQEDYKYSID